MRVTVTVTGVLLAALLCLPASARAELVVNISKSQQRLAVVIDGEEAFRWPISTGRRAYPTPTGKFRPVRLERHWYSRKYNMTPMPWSVFFYRGYAVHGTMEAHNLGRAVSHGCVRLRPDNASILYSLVRRHGPRRTQLVVMNGPLPRAPGTPMAASDTPAPSPAEEHFAKASPTDDDKRDQERQEHLSAKARTSLSVAATRHDVAKPDPARSDDDGRAVKPRARTRMAGAIAYSVSVGSDEAQILRERAAWLRSIDRKYGITH